MIRVGFSTSDKWISRLIRYWTNADASHAFILYFDPTLDQEMVLDVAFSGYRAIPRSLFEKDNKILYIVDPGINLNPGLRVVARWLGLKYDWRAFVAFSRWFRSFRHHPTENPKALICSEMVIHALRISGFPGIEQLDPKGTSPKDLLDFLRTSLETKEKY